MNRAQRREACRRWGHLPAGDRCARCGRELDWHDGDRWVLGAVIAAVCAALVGVALGMWLDYMRSR